MEAHARAKVEAERSNKELLRQMEALAKSTVEAERISTELLLLMEAHLEKVVDSEGERNIQEGLDARFGQELPDSIQICGGRHGTPNLR